MADRSTGGPAPPSPRGGAGAAAVPQPGAMRQLSGIGASDGIAIGPAWPLAAPASVPDRWIGDDQIAGESGRFDDAVQAADRQLLSIGGALTPAAQREGGLLVEAHRLILKSEEVLGSVRRLITHEHLSATSAVQRAIAAIAARFGLIENEYFRDRRDDVEDVGQRLLRTLLGLPAEPGPGNGAAGAIGIGVVLSPMALLRMRHIRLAGLVTERGGRTSHAAIIARVLELPYVVGVAGVCGLLPTGSVVGIDGGRGEVVVAPDAATVATFRERARQQSLRSRRLTLRGTAPATTRDGVHVAVAANAETVADVARAVHMGAESIGLVRTESLYLDRGELPSEEEQYRDAVRVVVAIGERIATFRTLDLGGDKLPAALALAPGRNPSLGLRAIRIARCRPDILRTQLRALYRASAIRPLRILLPLVSRAADVGEVRQLCASVREELRREGRPHDPTVPLGAMIETPSAAITADHIADVSDFLSLGTNDLVQYTCAADREDETVQYLYEPLHPAVLRLLQRVVAAAARAGKPLSICGDMAADPALVWLLIGLGLRELSMAPRHIPAVRSVIAGTRLADAEDVAAHALRLRSGRAVESYLTEIMARRFPLEVSTAAEARSVPSRRRAWLRRREARRRHRRHR